jgi:phytol kinase
MAAGIHLPVAAAATADLTPGAPANLAAAGLEHDLGVLLITSLIPLALVLATEVLKDRNKLTSVQSRKFLHISTGPLFALTWPLYSTSSGARCLAAMLPALMSLRFLLAGLGITREPRLVAGTAVSTPPQAHNF